MTNEQQIEFAKCMKSVSYFAFKYIKTLDVETNDRRAFAIFSAQTDRKEFSKVISDYMESLNKALTGKKKVLVYKRRQLYITTATLAWLLWKFLFAEDFKCIISTEKLGKADNPTDENTQLGRFRSMFNSLPEWLKPMIEDKTGYIANGTNTISVEGGDHPGRAGQTTVIWADEFAFQPRTGIRYTSMQESCKGMILLTSTPNGKHNKFYELYHNPPIDMDIIDLPITLRRTDEWVKGKRDSYKGNEEGFEQEIMGSWGGGMKGRVFTYWSTDALSDLTEEQLKGYIGRTQIYIGVDQGIAHPTAVVFIACLSGGYVVFDELAVQNTPIEGEGGTARAVKRKCDYWGINTSTATFYGDPSMDTRSRDTGVTAFDIWRREGINLNAGYNAVKEGILHINTLLAHGKLRVHKNCVMTQDAFNEAKYNINKYGFAVGDKYGEQDYVTDLLDALRYGLTNTNKIPVAVENNTVHRKRVLKGLGSWR